MVWRNKESLEINCHTETSIHEILRDAKGCSLGLAISTILYIVGILPPPPYLVGILPPPYIVGILPPPS